MAARFWVLGTGTWDTTNIVNWAATSNGVGGQSVPVAGDTVTFDASSGGGTVTVNHATLAVTSLTMGAFTGTLDFATNDNNITISNTLSITGTGTRTLNMGDGTWTLSTSSNGSPFDCSTVTNLTLNANGSTILFSATSPSVPRTFAGGGKSFNIVTIAAATTGFAFIFSGNGTTIATLNVTAPVNLLFTSNSTYTITNAFTWTGSASDRFLVGMFGSGAAPSVVATGGGTIEYAMIFSITFTTGTVTANNSYNLRSTAGITINEPTGSAVARVIGG